MTNLKIEQLIIEIYLVPNLTDWFDERHNLCDITYIPGLKQIMFFLIGCTYLFPDTLEENKVCPITHGTGSLSLGKDNRSAIIVRETTYFNDWSGLNDFDCKFTVKANFKMGVFAVIQSMSLRKDPVTDNCIDYIQVRNFTFFLSGNLLKTLCCKHK